jgi:cytochrome b561
MSVISTPSDSATRATHIDQSVWPRSVRWVHWATVALVLVAVAAVLGQDLFDDKALHKLVMNVHKQAGTLVLAVTGLRVLIRLGSSRPLDRQTGLTRWASAGAHGAIYLILFALPVLGWATVNARGGVVNLLGWALPALVARDRDLSDTLQEVHEYLGWTLIALVAAHVLAAIWHHHFKKDRVLLAMLGRKA